MKYLFLCVALLVAGCDRGTKEVILSDGSCVIIQLAPEKGGAWMVYKEVARAPKCPNDN